jgi:hypothetical protein
MSVSSRFVIMMYHARQRLVEESMLVFSPLSDLFFRKKECISCPFMLSLVAFCLDYWLRPYEPPLAPRDALLG